MSTEDLGATDKGAEGTSPAAKTPEEKPFKPESALVRDFPHLFENLPPQRLKYVDNKIGGSISVAVFGEPNYGEVLAALSERTPSEDKPKIELEECIGAGSFTTVWRGKINGVPT